MWEKQENRKRTLLITSQQSIIGHQVYKTTTETNTQHTKTGNITISTQIDSFDMASQLIAKHLVSHVPSQPNQNKCDSKCQMSPPYSQLAIQISNNKASGRLPSTRTGVVALFNHNTLIIDYFRQENVEYLILIIVT